MELDSCFMKLYTTEKGVISMAITIQDEKNRKIQLLGETVPNDDKIEYKIPVGSKLSELNEVLDKYRHSKGKALEEAEYLHADLKKFLQLFYKHHKYPSNSKPLMALDFMGHRGLLSNDILKKRADIKRLEFFNTKAKCKALTTKFFNFITDRNILAHGLPVVTKKNELMLQHIDNVSRAPAYAILNKGFFKDYRKTNQELEQAILNLSAYIRKKYKDHGLS